MSSAQELRKRTVELSERSVSTKHIEKNIIKTRELSNWYMEYYKESARKEEEYIGESRPKLATSGPCKGMLLPRKWRDASNGEVKDVLFELDGILQFLDWKSTQKPLKAAETAPSPPSSSSVSSASSRQVCFPIAFRFVHNELGVTWPKNENGQRINEWVIAYKRQVARWKSDHAWSQWREMKRRREDTDHASLLVDAE